MGTTRLWESVLKLNLLSDKWDIYQALLTLVAYNTTQNFGSAGHLISFDKIDKYKIFKKSPHELNIPPCVDINCGD